MSPDDPRHGTYAGSNAHWDDGEDSCDSCRTAATKYQKIRKLRMLEGTPNTVPILGAQRRLQALACLGYGFATVAREMGCTREEVRRWATTTVHDRIGRRTHDRISLVYEQLSMTLPAPNGPVERRSITLAMNLANRRGYLPPLAWVDIDDPSERPDLTIRDHLPDPVVIDRILAGDFAIKPTRSERYEVIARWPGSDGELERSSGWNVARDRREMKASEGAENAA